MLWDAAFPEHQEPSRWIPVTIHPKDLSKQTNACTDESNPSTNPRYLRPKGPFLYTSPHELHDPPHQGSIFSLFSFPPWLVPRPRKKAGAIITNRGGRTCHAAIIARELGIPAIVGCGDATDRVSKGRRSGRSSSSRRWRRVRWRMVRWFQRVQGMTYKMVGSMNLEL